MANPFILLALLHAQAAPPSGGSAEPEIREASAGVDTLEQASVDIVARRSRVGGAVVDASVDKVAAPLHEIPRSVTVLQADELRERGVRTVAQTLSMVPGVFTNGTNGAGGYHYKARGYHMPPSVYLVDGFSGVRAGGDYSPSLFGIDRVVFMRGPAGLAYGAMSVPGGMVNMVTKAPQEEPLRRVDVRMGPWSESSVGFGNATSWGLDLDLAGKASEDGRLTYRAVGNWENISGFTADTRDSSRRFLGSLLWKLDAEGRHTLRPLVQWDWTSRRAGASTVISPSSSLTTNDGSSALAQDDLTSIDVNHYAGGRQDEQFTIGFDFKSRPVDVLAVNAAYRWLSYDTDIDQWAPVASTLKQVDPADPRSWVVSRQQTRSRTERFGHALDANLQHLVEVPDLLRNTATVGWNGRYSGTDRSSSAKGKVQSPINVYTGLPTEPLRDSALLPTPAFLTESLAWNLYLMDQISVLENRLIVSGGLAWAGESLDRDYRRTGVVKDTVADIDRILADRFGGPVPTLGILFQALPQVAVYGSYATSFSLPNGEYEDRQGRAGGFDPSTGVNVEGGLKFDGFGQSATVSVFHVAQEDVLVQSAVGDLNTNGNQFWTQSDDEGRESFGMELAAQLAPLKGLSTSIAAAWIDARLRSGTDPVADGSPVDKTPEWSATLHNRYAFSTGPLRGLAASATVNWQTERWMSTKSSAAPDPLVMPWTTKLDLGMNYAVTARLEVAANLENVFDETIVESGNTGASLVLGSPRNLVVRLGYGF